MYILGKRKYCKLLPGIAAHLLTKGINNFKHTQTQTCEHNFVLHVFTVYIVADVSSGMTWRLKTIHCQTTNLDRSKNIHVCHNVYVNTYNKEQHTYTKNTAIKLS